MIWGAHPYSWKHPDWQICSLWFFVNTNLEGKEKGKIHWYSLDFFWMLKDFRFLPYLQNSTQTQAFIVIPRGLSLILLEFGSPCPSWRWQTVQTPEVMEKVSTFRTFKLENQSPNIPHPSWPFQWLHFYQGKKTFKSMMILLLGVFRRVL